MTNMIDGEDNETAWEYDSLGRMTKKTYADGSFYEYSYSARGWLLSRIDAMSQTTSYEYDNAGQLTKVDYPTDTDVEYVYDSIGRMTQRVDSAGTWSWTYDGQSSRILTEVTPFTQTVTYTYHTNTTYELASVSLDTTNKTEYFWSQGRLTNVTSSAGSFAYSYKANSDLLETTTYLNGTVIVSRAYDNADRLTGIFATNSSAGTIINSFTYTLDSVGRRIQRQDADGVRLDWGYDNYDQLTSAGRTNGPNGAADAAYDYAFQYDEIGNRLKENRGQMELDGTYNPLNQLISQGWAGKLDVYGSVATTNAWFTNKVNGVTSKIYNGTNYLGGAKLGAGSNVISIVTFDAVGTNENHRTVYAPPVKPQQFTYDANGNMTSDGYRSYSWDEENRLTNVESTASVPADEKKKLEFVYDGMGRRVEKTVCSDWNGSAYGSTNVVKYVYDGWNVISAHSTGSGQTNTDVFIWGLDLSGTLQGAGGVGGLLCNLRSAISNSCVVYTYDGNGNVTDIIGTNGTSVAHYEYDPFGRTVAKSGTFAEDNPWRFSTKYQDESGLYYYGYRYYSPELRRWLNRDPIGEKITSTKKQCSYFAKPSYDFSSVEPNLCGFTVNNPIDRIDRDGRLTFPVHGRWCGPGYCGNGRQVGCEGDTNFWNRAGNYPADDDLDQCCKNHDSCLGQRMWDPNVGAWVPDPLPRTPGQCDADLCTCARNARSGGGSRRSIICLFCLAPPHGRQ